MEEIKQLNHAKTSDTHGPRKIIDFLTRALHPLTFVIVSLLIAGGSFLSNGEIRALATDQASIFKLFGGAILLVLIAAYFQQLLQIRQTRSEIENHFAATSEKIDRMVKAIDRNANQQKHSGDSR